MRLSAMGAAHGSRITKRRIHLPRKFLSSACAISPAPTRTIACEMTVKTNVCQTACWKAGLLHSWRKFPRPTHLPCRPVVAFVKLSQIARPSGAATSTVTKMTAGEMSTDARTPGRSKTFVQRLPLGRATAAASTRPRSYAMCSPIGGLFKVRHGALDGRVIEARAGSLRRRQERRLIDSRRGDGRDHAREADE